MKTNEYYGGIKYRMTKEMAKQIIALHKGERLPAQKILCNYVNNNHLIKGNCVEVSTDL